MCVQLFLRQTFVKFAAPSARRRRRRARASPTGGRPIRGGNDISFRREDVFTEYLPYGTGARREFRPELLQLPGTPHG